MVETTRQNADFLRGLPQKQAEVVDLADKILQSKVEHINEKSAAHQTVLKEERSALESADVSKLQTVEIAQYDVFNVLHLKSMLDLQRSSDFTKIFYDLFARSLNILSFFIQEPSVPAACKSKV